MSNESASEKKLDHGNQIINPSIIAKVLAPRAGNQPSFFILSFHSVAVLRMLCVAKALDCLYPTFNKKIFFSLSGLINEAR